MKEKLKNCSLKVKIQLTYAVFILVPVFVLAVSLYVFFSQYVMQSVLSGVRVGGQQIANNISGFLDSVEQLSVYPIMDKEIVGILRENYSQEKADEIRKIENSKKVEDKLYYNMMNMNSKINEVCIYSTNKEYSYIKSMSSSTEQYRPEGEEWYGKVQEADGAAVLLGTQPNQRASGKEPIIAIARSIEDPVGEYSLGIVIIKIKVSDFIKLWQGTGTEEQNVIVSDEKGTLIYSPDIAVDPQDMGEIISLHLDEKGVQSYSGTKNKTSYHVVCTKIGGTEWNIYQFVSKDKLLEQPMQIVRFIIMVSFLMLISLIVMASKISRSITKPIEKLAQTMNLLEQGNLKIRAPRMYGEMGTLSRQFNKMMDETNALIERIYEAEKEKREAELKALQAQINPHFMYNTLNSIKMMAKMQGAHNITGMLEAFIRLLMNAAKVSEEFVSIESEVELIYCYVEILNMRYFNQFRVEYKIAENVLKYQTIRFILQPIVENAIIHGLSEKVEGARLCIHIYLEGENVEMKVTDNGVGMSEEKCREILGESQDLSRQFNKIGIYNVNQRIKMAFGEEYGVSVQSRQNEYTAITVTIPRIQRTTQGEKNENTDCR